MKPVKKTSSLEKPQLCSDRESERRPVDTQPSNDLHVALSRQPVTETDSVPPDQNQGPRSDRVGVNGLERSQSVLTQDASSLANIARLRTTIPSQYQSMNFNPQIHSHATRINSITQPYNNDINSMNQNVVTVLTIRERRRPVRNHNLTQTQEQQELDRCRDAYDQEYLNSTNPSLSKRLELASVVISVSFTLEGKYKVLNIWRIIELNKVRGDALSNVYLNKRIELGKKG